MSKEIVYQGSGKLYPSKGTVCTAEEGKTRQEDAQLRISMRFWRGRCRGCCPWRSAKGFMRT